MGAIGDVLEAMHDAPRASSLHGTGRQGTDHETLQEAFARRSARGGTHTRTLISMAPEGATLPSGFHDSNVEFWFSQVGWRVDHAEARTIASDGKVLRFHPGMGGVLGESDDDVLVFEGLSTYLTPVHLMGGARFRVIDEELHGDRPCWHVSTDAIPGPSPRPALLFVADSLDVELWIDQATGIVLRAEGRLDGTLAARFVVDDVEVDASIDPAVFALVTPDGSPVRTHGEMQLDDLRTRGVDVTGIDPGDADAIQDALRSSMSGPRAAPDLENLAGQHIPIGPPPENEEDARIDVGAAFEGLRTLSDDSSALVNVQGGENLGPCAAEVRRRFPQQATGGQMRVERIKFLHEREAVVWFEVPYLGRREGRAIFVDGRWKVSRATYCTLIALAGAQCPPPPDLHQREEP